MSKVYNGFLIFIALFSWACDSEDDGTVRRSMDSIVIAYLAADNNLSEAGYRKVSQMEAGYTGIEGDHLYIFHDPEDDVPYLIHLYSDGDLRRTETRYPETDSSDARFFGNLVSDILSGHQDYKAGLIMFSHSSGWLPHGSLENPTRTLAVDNADGMELADAAAALPDGKLQFIIFESCYSAGIEVLYALRDKADYFLFSSAEILDPGFLNVYKGSLGSLFDMNGAPLGFAGAAYDFFNGQSGWMRSATLSIARSDTVTAIVEFLKGKIQYRVTEPDPYWQYFDRNIETNGETRLVYDFYDYYSSFLNDEDTQGLFTLLADCIIWRAATPTFLDNRTNYDGFVIARHSGLTAFVPQKETPLLNEQYRQTEWYKALYQ